MDGADVAYRKRKVPINSANAAVPWFSTLSGMRANHCLGVTFEWLSRSLDVIVATPIFSGG